MKVTQQCVVSITGSVVFEGNHRENRGIDAPDVSIGRVYVESGRDIVLYGNASVLMDSSVRGDEGALSVCGNTVLIAVEVCRPGTYRDELLNVCKCCPPFYIFL